MWYETGNAAVHLKRCVENSDGNSRFVQMVEKYPGLNNSNLADHRLTAISLIFTLAVRFQYASWVSFLPIMHIIYPPLFK